MNSRIKLSARAAMCGSYSKILPALSAVILLFLLFSGGNAVINKFSVGTDSRILASAALISLPAAVAVISPLCLLLQVNFLMLAKGSRRTDRPHIGLSGSLKACDLCVRLFFIKFFWLVVFEAVPVSAAVMLFYRIRQGTVSIRAAYAAVTGLLVLGAAGLIFWLIYIQRYSESMFFLACYKDFTAGDAINESIRKTRNGTLNIFLFKLSFVPWLLLCAGVLPAFYVIPYYKQSVTCLFLDR